MGHGGHELSRLHRPASASPRSATRTRAWPRVIAEQARDAGAHVEPVLPSAPGAACRAALPAFRPDRVFFCNSGTEAVEACLKFARRYWFTQGETARTRFVALRRAVSRPHVRLAVDHGGRALPRAVRAAAAGRDVRRRRRSRGARCGRHRRDGGDRRSSRFRAKAAFGRCRRSLPRPSTTRRAARGALVHRRRGAERAGPHRPRVLLARRSA